MLSRRQLLLMLTLFAASLESCSLEDKSPRTIRAHVDIKQGVAHARGSQHAERYCQYCHGEKLIGGVAAQPSCYNCHGQNWARSAAEFRFAPEDHTNELGGYWHHPATTQADTVCVNCHGSDLLGDSKLGTPSCLLCHELRW